MRLQSVRLCYGLRGIRPIRFEIRFERKTTIRRSLIFNQLFSENNLVALTFCININKLYKCKLIQCQLLSNTSAACITCHLITKWNICISYTLRVKKTCHSIFVHNFDQSQLTCKILSQVALHLSPFNYTAWMPIELSSVLRSRQHSIGYGRRFLQVKRPNQQYQSTEGTQRLHNQQKSTISIHKHKTQQIP